MHVLGISLGSASKYILTLSQPSKAAMMLLITTWLKQCCYRRSRTHHKHTELCRKTQCMMVRHASTILRVYTAHTCGLELLCLDIPQLLASFRHLPV